MGSNQNKNQMKRQLSKCGKVTLNEATDKGLISKIFKQLIPLNIRRRKKKRNKTNPPNQKIGRRPKQKFLQRRHIDGQQTDEIMLNTAHH